VNQRALIDKVLARYSGEFTGQSRLPRVPLLALLEHCLDKNTVFRELLQNSDDAGARSVEIRFETEEYLSREKGDEPRSDEPKQEDLPDLKTAVACGYLMVD